MRSSRKIRIGFNSITCPLNPKENLMKKFSTAVLLAVLLTGFLPLHAAWSASACEWAPNAPDKHHVQAGDTLWDIASLFLNNPWCWPKVWKPNQNLIPNPHWIYPGQVIVLNRVSGTLSVEVDNAVPLQHLSPTIRITEIARSPLPLLSEKLQSLFARTPLISIDALPNAPTVREIESGRVMAGKGDSVFVIGDLGSNEQFDVFRVVHSIVDPDSKRPLGVAGLNVGRVRLSQHSGALHKFQITRSEKEVSTGDKLVPVSDSNLAPLFPHPGKVVDGKLAAILHDGRWARMHDIVVINRGSVDGLDPGSVVKVVRQVRIRPNENPLSNPLNDNKQTIGTLLVFKVQEKISLAMIMHARDAITIGDSIISPNTEAP
jgi:hypothetical protein